MKSIRLKTICSLLNKTDKMIDVGCDHAYVCIEMYHQGMKHILASDIHPKALEMAKKNIQQANCQIKTILSDGLNHIDTSTYNTLVIAGMGYSTIKHILENPEKLKPIQKIILESNNDLKKVRLLIDSIGFYLKKEILVKEASHDYFIMECARGSKKLSKVELEFGLYHENNKKYYKELDSKFTKLLEKIPEKNQEKYQEIKEKLLLLQEYL